MYDGSYWVWMNASIEADTATSVRVTTGAATAAKTGWCNDYQLLDKSYVHVLISTSNTAQSKLTLNINGKGAKDIYINGTVSSASNYTLPAGTYIVYYADNKYYFRTDGLLTNDVTNLCTNVNQITWCPAFTNACESVTTGSRHFYMHSDHLLYVSIECNYKNSTGATLTSYGQNTTNVFFRFENSRLSTLNGCYSEVMVDINATLYPAFATFQTINNTKYLCVALRTNVSLPTGNGNVRFTFTLSCNYN